MNNKIYDLADKCFLPVEKYRNEVQQFADQLLSMFNHKLQFIKNSDDVRLAIKEVEEEIYELGLSSEFASSNKIYVVAGTYQQYLDFLALNGVMVNKSKYIYVSSPDILRGVRGIHVIYYGTYKNRKDYDELMLYVSIANR